MPVHRNRKLELLCNIAGHYGSGMYAEFDAAPA